MNKCCKCIAVCLLDQPPPGHAHAHAAAAAAGGDGDGDGDGKGDDGDDGDSDGDGGGGGGCDDDGGGDDGGGQGLRIYAKKKTCVFFSHCDEGEASWVDFFVDLVRWQRKKKGMKKGPPPDPGKNGFGQEEKIPGAGSP